MKKEIMLVATIYKTTYVKAESEKEARSLLRKQLNNELDDTYNIADIETADEIGL